jgi:cobalt/nickel transport protein
MNRKEITIGLIIALVLAGAISLFASSFPDGLEKVAEKLGFLEKGEGKPTIASPVPDYTFPGLKNERLATSIAGIIGTLAVFGFGYGLAALIKYRRNQ